MEEEWDADGFEPKLKVESKWADEDADDEVKDNWEDEDEEEEEKKDTEKQDEPAGPVSTSQPPRKSKKNLARKIEEKERQEEAQRQMTPEEKIAEKLRQQKMQEEADLKVARETFGVAETSTGLDAMNPTTKDEFEEFSKALVKKILPYSTSQHFPFFAEELIRNMCVAMNSADMKKLKNTLDNLQLEKAKMEKGDKAKKNKGKGKAKLRIEGESAIVNEYSAYGDMDEYDDFM